MNIIRTIVREKFIILELMSCTIKNSIWDPNAITIAEELDRPYAVVMSRNTSSLFIADTFHHRVVEYDLNLQTYIRVYNRTDAGDTVKIPLGLAVAEDGSELLITDFESKAILRWSFPSYRSTIVSMNYYSGHIGVAVDRNKTIYATEHMMDSITSYDPNTGPMWNYKEWYYPHTHGGRDIFILNDDIYLVQTQLCRVVKISLIDQNQTVTVVAGSGRIGSTTDRLRFPWGLAVDPIEGHVFVSDSKNHRIQLCKSIFLGSLFFCI